MQNDNYLSHLLHTLKNNKLVAYVLLFAIIVIGIGNFTDALNHIIVLFDTSTETQATYDKPQSMTKTSKSENDLLLTDSQYETYEVILVLPSRMSDAKIFVDCKPANVITRTLTVITIRVLKSRLSHSIVIKKGESECRIDRLILQNNLRLQPCQ